MRIFGGVRRSAAGAVALIIAMTGLVVVGASAPASAVGIACSASVDRFDGGRLPGRPRGMEQVTSAVLSINMPPPEYPEYATRSLVMQAGGWEEIARLAPQAQEGQYTFSTQGGIEGVASQPGETYHSAGLQRLLSFYSSGEPVSFREESDYSGVRSIAGYWRLDLTFSDCDTDDDGAADNAVDNCDGLRNPDQRDFDRDGAGDACDADDDGDGAADTKDNCAMLANDQTDSDGDAIGNACDSTPFPPAPPSGTTTGSTTTGPAPGPTTGPVAAARTLTLKYAKRKRVFRGVVASAVGSCAAYAEASLWRKKRGADRRLVISTTDEAGTFRTPKVRKPGKYYVTIDANADGSCAGVRSPLVRIRRR